MTPTPVQTPAYLGHIILLTDVIVAAALWILRSQIFTENADLMAAAIGCGLMIPGIIVFFILKKNSRKVL